MHTLSVLEQKKEENKVYLSTQTPNLRNIKLGVKGVYVHYMYILTCWILAEFYPDADCICFTIDSQNFDLSEVKIMALL